MIGTFTLLFAVTAVPLSDPRPQIVELQLAGKDREALARVDLELAARPEEARRLGFDYLRGHLLDRLGDPEEASEAFVTSMSTTPALVNYSRYRLALEQERLGHPEMAAGLVATTVAGGSASPLIPDAVRLLSQTLARGGDCRLLGGIRAETLPAGQRRELQIAQADCAMTSGMPELARGLLVSVLSESRTDEPARAAADRLSGFVVETERGRLPFLLGLTFHQHREFERALRHLKRSYSRDDALPRQDAFEARYASGRAQFWQERFAAAAVAFGELVKWAETSEQRARALYQRGRSYELLGQARNAAASFHLAYAAEPRGKEWAAPSLLSLLRLEWHRGNEAAVTQIFALLTSRREWSDATGRAALFLASSDLVRGRSDRARAWLDRAALGNADDRPEVAYWRGRLAELEGNERGAVAAYLDAMRPEPHHPLARAARTRLAAEPLARVALAQGRRLAATVHPDPLYNAWLLLGDGDSSGRLARRNLQVILLADRGTSPYLRLSEVPVRSWPLWNRPLTTPEEMLLALGILHEGSAAVSQHFPLGDPSLAYTGSLILSRGGELKRSIQTAAFLRLRTPPRLPLAFQDRDYQRLLFPNPYQELILAQSRQRGVNPDLLAALIREESVYDRFALSPSSARGLTQLTLQTARRLGSPQTGPEDLYRPDVSITLGAAHLGELLKEFGGAPHLAVAAYNAGEPQVKVWKRYCVSQEPEEFLAKVGFRETRAYLRRVLTSASHYSELY